MTKRSRITAAILSSLGMAALILDSKTAMYGAAEGIDICIRTVIPSLLPFFVLSILLTNAVTGIGIPLLSPVKKLCGIPEGAESLLLIGLLGGYPVGAQSIAEAYSSGSLTQKDAHRMLGFCSNAGPAFIFGIAGGLFSSKKTVLILWCIHLLSALAVGAVLPDRQASSCILGSTQKCTVSKSLSKALRIMAGVCGWIVLFRILIAFLDRWIFWMLPQTARLLLIGVLELANGCHSLLQAQSEAQRLILCAVILGFGGICVGMQTVSVTGKLGTGLYFPGKLMQSLFSLVLSVMVSHFLYESFSNKVLLSVLISSTVFLLLILLVLRKKTVAFWSKQVYNHKKSKRRLRYAVSQEN